MSGNDFQIMRRDPGDHREGPRGGGRGRPPTPPGMPEPPEPEDAGPGDRIIAIGSYLMLTDQYQGFILVGSHAANNKPSITLQ